MLPEQEKLRAKFVLQNMYIVLGMGDPEREICWCALGARIWGVLVLRHLRHALRRAIWVIILEQGTLYPLRTALLNGEWSSQHCCPF